MAVVMEATAEHPRTQLLEAEVFLGGDTMRLGVQLVRESAGAIEGFREARNDHERLP